MKRFENAQIGDEVYCRMYGNGIIKNIDSSESYLHIICFFEKNNRYRRYSLDGKHDYYCEEPILFYRKGSEKYLTERPEPEIDWKKVPVGTKVITSDIINNLKTNNPVLFMGYFHELEYPFWSFDGDYKMSANGYKYCKLAEPCKLEWIKNNEKK